MNHALTIAAVLSCTLASACATSSASGQKLAPLTPTEQFAIQVRPAADEIQLAPHGILSANQKAALGALVMRWRDVGEGSLVIQATGERVASDTAQAAAAALQAIGVPATSIRLAALEGPAGSPVKVGFGTFEAVGPQCAHLWGNPAHTFQNRSYATFGCTTTANFAAQIADPRDLIAPQPADAPDSRRRVLKANSFLKGEEPVLDNSGAGAK